MGDDVGNEPALPDPGVEQEDRPHHGQRGPERAARGLEEEHDPHRAHHDLGLGRQACARGRGQLARIEEDIEGAARPREGQHQSRIGTRSRGELFSAG